MATPKPPRPTTRQRLARVVLLTTCAGVGCGAGIVVRGVRTPLTDQSVEVHAQTEPELDADGPDPVRKRIDDYIRSAAYSSALNLIEQIREENHESDPGLTYREALCREGQERWAKATELYARLRTATSAPALHAVAAFGQARCEFATGDLKGCERTIAACVPVAGCHPNGEAELVYQRVRLAVQSLTQPAPGPFATRHLAWCPLDCPPSEYLDWLAPDEHRAASADAPPPPPLDQPLAAEQAVRDALRSAARHPDGFAVRLVAANLAFADGRVVEAGRVYQKLKADHPPPGVAVAAHYNLGLCLLRSQNAIVARTAFQDAADLGRGTRFENLGWWWTGRTDLDAGQLADARRAWRKATERPDREIESAAAVGIALTYHLEGDEDRAAKALHGEKIATQSPQPEFAEVLAARSRYSANPSPLRAEVVARAVAAAEYGRPFGPAGEYLLGSWLAATGNPEQGAAVFEAALESASGVWAKRMAFDLGEHLLRTKHTAAAKRRLAGVAAADDGDLGDRAKLRLAEIAAREKAGGECVRLCRSLLGRDAVNPDTVLGLMGRGYELLGRPREAAECFAGRVPAGPTDPLHENHP
ncbi:MAG: tetratricopeptide repeat protein [Gemmataceae bacterium]